MKIAIVTTDNREHFKDYKAPVPYFGTAPEALLQGFAMMPELEVHVIGCTQQPLESPEKLAANIWFHSIHVPKIGWLRTSYQGCIRSVRRKLKAINPDIVHGQGTERDCAISTVFSKLPNVLTIHGNMQSIAKLHGARPLSYFWLTAQLENFTVPRSSGVVCITQYTQQAVKDLARQTWLVPNAVDQSFFGIDAKAEGTPTILCVGQVCYRKNQTNFIKALDLLTAKKKFKVLFLGEANKTEPVGAEFLDLVAERPWCEYSGFVDRETIRKHFKTATMLALPSLEDNCPMVVLEAMAAGVPVLAAKVGGLPDLIQENENGLFCDPLDAVSMRTGVAKLLDDEELAAELTVTAKSNAIERFHPLVVAQKHVEIYREVLSKPPLKSDQ